MKTINKKTSLKNLAAIIVEHLSSKGISAVMVGGSVVSLYTENEYQSRDIDFISPADHKEITKAMEEIGFSREGKDFVHKNTDFSVEFPTGPLALGDDTPIEPEGEITVNKTKIQLFSPTQSVMDRLASYYYFHDRQCFDQALMIAKAQEINLDKVRSWSEREGESEKYELFLKRLKES